MPGRTNNRRGQKGRRGTQRGGASSDFIGLNYALTAAGPNGGNNASISAATLANIGSAPMFNPFSSSAVIPTSPSLGIVPNGLALAGMAPTMSGGGRRQQRPRRKLTGAAYRAAVARAAHARAAKAAKAKAGRR